MIDAIKKLGATNAAIITTDKIETDTSFRDICASNSCGMFGRCWMCPPDIGDIDKLMQDIHNYQYALVYQFVAPIEDSYDFEGMIDAKKEFVRITRGISRYLKEHPKRETLHLGAGGCGICEKCAKQTDEPCRFPDEALPSLEGYGVNVYRLAQSADMKYINGQNTVTYFGAVLFNN